MALPSVGFGGLLEISLLGCLFVDSSSAIG